MQKRKNFLGIFLGFIILSLIVFAIFQIPLFKPVTSLVQGIFSPVQKITHNIFLDITNIGRNKELESLKSQNLSLIKRLAYENKLAEDNKALRDQFETTNIKSQTLIPVNVVGSPGFIPGVSVPENLIIDRGEADGIKIGDAIIYKDNLVGKVTKTTTYLSVVTLISSQTLSFTAKTVKTETLGVLKGEGGGDMILDNVLLSDKLSVNDVIVTKGDLNEKGQGFPPDLVVGKISSVSKNPSDLFQKAEVKSFIDFSKINMVFVQIVK